MNLRRKGLLLTFLLAVSGHATSAGYFRVWQGFQRRDLNCEQFLSGLPGFMKDTVDLYYPKVLNNYLVAIPPKDKPAFVPEEFALVALTNEAGYREIRETPEGKHYADRHWDLFEREISKSAPYVNYQQNPPAALVNNTAYDLLGKPVDWTKGVTLFYLGLRKQALDADSFLGRLKDHIEFAAKSLAPQGLNGYIVIANENYEAAYLNFSSEEAMKEAFQSFDGQLLAADGAEFMSMLQWTAAVPFYGQPVKEGQFYTTVPSQP